jgi:hypothetical protein
VPTRVGISLPIDQVSTDGWFSSRVTVAVRYLRAFDRTLVFAVIEFGVWYIGISSHTSTPSRSACSRNHGWRG